jgi:dienelactone hydrolase
VTCAATLAALVLSACAPDIPSTPRETARVSPRFDPSATPAVVPTPNDLALRPESVTESTPRLDAEFLAHLREQDGFPGTTAATVTFSGPLTAASVTPATVRVLDITQPTAVAPVADVGAAYVEATAEAPARVVLTPPGGRWGAGRKYAVVVLGGEAGVKAADGRGLVGTTAWALMRSAEPLVTCQDLAAADCAPVPSVIPAVSTDLAGRAAEQLAAAKRLEALRRSYAPLLDALAATGTPRERVALLWTFRITPNAAQAEFDPGASTPRVPSPNDLAIDPATGLVNVAVDPASSPAQQEFVRDYLNTLDGFSATSTASLGITAEDLDPATVTAATVRLLDITAPAPAPVAGVAPAYDAAADVVRFTPPGCGWPRGRRYAVAVLGGGASGVRTASGKPLVPSAAWFLVRGTTPLVTCEDLSAADCKVAGSAVPLSLEQARSLERLRRSYKPLLDGLAAGGVQRSDVALLWTFRITTRPEATFNPAAGVIPFPNNVLLANPGTANQRVALPVPTTPGLQQQLVAGLNTLDGFSLTASPVSENSDACAAATGDLDEATLASGARMLNVTPVAGAQQPRATPCLGCTSVSPGAGRTQGPQELQFRLDRPLEERNAYAALLTAGVKSTDGKALAASPLFAFVRSSAPLLQNGKSTVAQLTDAQATSLEPLRVAYQQVISVLLQTTGTQRKDLALAWAFTTQSTRSSLRAAVDAVQASATAPVVTAQSQAALLGQLQGAGRLTADVGALWAGTVSSPGNGPFAPALPRPTEAVPYLMAVPAGTAPAGGWPLVVFGHGLGGSRWHLLPIASALARAGLASIAIDTPLHGDRSDCRGAPAGACATGASCQPDGPSAGLCLNGDGALAFTLKGGADPFTPAISGWNINNALNLFATRDNYRRHVLDLTQLVRALHQTGEGSLEAAVAAPLDNGNVSYVGQSLGGILGTLFMGSNEAATRAVLNVPGADLVGIQTTSPSFAPVFAGVNQTLAAAGLAQGTPGYENFFRIARWALDPADPQNFAFYMLNQPPAGASAERAVLVQSIDEDATVPNATTQRLVSAANREVTGQANVQPYHFTAGRDFSAASRPVCARHGFLLAPQGRCGSPTAVDWADAATTQFGQSQAVTFLLTGTVQTTP